MAFNFGHAVPDVVRARKEAIMSEIDALKAKLNQGKEQLEQFRLGPKLSIVIGCRIDITMIKMLPLPLSWLEVGRAVSKVCLRVSVSHKL